MTLEERVLDISQRLARELGQDRQKLTEQRAKFAEILDDERKSLSAELEAKQQQLEHERCSMEHARSRINAVVSDVDDEVLELNVGGRGFAARRSTLCQFEGSYLSNLFSGRWESSIERDAEGRFFLDFDPASFRLILNFLRNKRIESDAAPCLPPKVPADMEERFSNLLEYLGLSDDFSKAKMASDEFRAANEVNDSKIDSAENRSSLLLSASTMLTALRTSAVQAATDVVSVAATATGAPFPMAPPQPPGPMPAAIEPRAGTTLRSRAPIAHSSLATLAGAEYRGREQRIEEVSMAPTSPNHDESFSLSCSGESSRSPADTEGTTAGWSKKLSHYLATQDANDPGRISIGDSRSLAVAAAVRSTRGIQAGKHGWEIIVETCSDWSYIGFVSQCWSATSSPIGRSSNSWGVASNGIAYRDRQEVKELQRFSSSSQILFYIDMDSRSANVVIDGKEFKHVFRDLPAPLYPAVSNCRSPARYYIKFLDAADLPP